MTDLLKAAVSLAYSLAGIIFAVGACVEFMHSNLDRGLLLLIAAFVVGGRGK